MEELKNKIMEILDEKFINHKGLNKLAGILSSMLHSNYDDTLFALRELEKQGDIFEFTKNKYASSVNLGLVKGSFSASNPNFGFVLREGGDIFISRKNMNRAFDGDTVLVKILTLKMGSKKPEGKIVKILERGNDGLVGTFRQIKNYGYVTLDKKNFEVKIPANETLGAKDDDKVVVDITSYKSGNAIGRITEVIGSLSDVGNDIKWLLRQYKIIDTFPDEVIRTAQSLEKEIDKNDYKNRRDLTGEMLFTIDGKDAKDLDDAVSLEKNVDGTYKLGVHIADVGEYVKLGGVIDEEAFNRGTSIYFLNQVIPMLPRELSNGICSLNPDVDRLALSVEMKIDKNGEVISSDIFESVIRSKHRLNYDEVLEVIEGNKTTQNRLSDIKDTLLNMYELSKILDDRRKKYGSLDFDLPEGVVLVDENNKPLDVVKRTTTKSTKIIETFMVMANEVVAKKFESLKIPFVYRVHESPDPDKIHTFYNFIDTLGIKHEPSSNKEIEPKDLQDVLNSIKGKDVESVVNMIMLRSLKKAKYMNKCLGHFGMALNYYCHFTSPIRRYPDLTIHRIIKEYLHKNESFIKSTKMADFVVKASEKSSTQEKNSEDVERAITDYKKCEYMSQFIGKTFEGIISSVNSKGFHVELENTCEGFVSIATMKDDFYDFDEENLMLVSKSNYYRIGEKVEVKLLDCELRDRKINFQVIKKIRKSTNPHQSNVKTIQK